MFWIQILLPMAVGIAGLVLLYLDNGYQKSLVNRIYLETRDQLIEVVEKQPDKSQIKERLIEIGRPTSNSYGEFRYQQFLVTTFAAMVPLLAFFLFLVSFFESILLSALFGSAGYFLFDKYLSSQVKKRRDLIEAEFPAIIEMLTLAIAAGETPLGAFARIAERSDSKLAEQFAKVVGEVRNGAPFQEALDRMGRSLKSPTIRRFVDALVMAMVRGAPIVDVLHRHVAEARINQRNLVMDKAGKAETTMMIPIVFLILPISVLFALWPSINQLSFFAS